MVSRIKCQLCPKCGSAAAVRKCPDDEDAMGALIIFSFSFFFCLAASSDGDANPDPVSLQ